MSSNPFEDNPFADPAIQNVTQTTQRTQMTLEDYNPFAQNNTVVPKPAAAAAIIPTSVQSKTPTTQSSPPLYATSAAQNINIDSIRRQEEELARKAAELDRKEQALRNVETGTTGFKNFPPLPTWFCFKPCFYQDINVEIPVDFQKWVRMLYYLWIFHGCTLFFNFIGAIVVWIAGSTNGGVSFALALVYFLIFTPCSYVCWFRPAYKAFRSDSSFNFMTFFFIFFCQTIINIFEAIGIAGSGFCGLTLVFTIFSQSGIGNIVAGVFVLLISACFIFISIADIILLLKIHRLYRSTGASFEAAQREFASNVLSNKNVQNAAATVITESAKATVQNYSSAGTSTPGRF